MRFADYLGEPDDDRDASPDAPAPTPNPAFGRITATPAPVDPAEPSTWPSPWATGGVEAASAPTAEAPEPTAPGPEVPPAPDASAGDRHDRANPRTAPADDLMPHRNPSTRPRRGRR
ncbi:MAG: hypothetical protein ACKO2C_06640 [Actinomycetes bacterium]